MSADVASRERRLASRGVSGEFQRMKRAVYVGFPQHDRSYTRASRPVCNALSKYTQIGILHCVRATR